MSCSSLRQSSWTTAPPRSSRRTKPSAASSRSASRTGRVLTAISSAMLACTSRVPPGMVPVTMPWCSTSFTLWLAGTARGSAGLRVGRLGHAGPPSSSREQRHVAGGAVDRGEPGGIGRAAPVTVSGWQPVTIGTDRLRATSARCEPAAPERAMTPRAVNSSGASAGQRAVYQQDGVPAVGGRPLVRPARDQASRGLARHGRAAAKMAAVLPARPRSAPASTRARPGAARAPRGDAARAGAMPGTPWWSARRPGGGERGRRATGRPGRD